MKATMLGAARVQLRTISALVVREALAKYGHESLGFFWIMVEPLVFSGAVMVMWHFAHHGNVDQIGIVPFILTGYCGITLWRHLSSGSVQALRRRSSLVFHSNVKFFDILLSLSILETLGIFTGFTVAYVPLMAFGVMTPVNDPLLLIGGWLFLGWVSFSASLILAALSELNETLEKFIPATMYVTIPLTGVFSMVEWLPERAQQVLLWSPLVHAMEMFRAGAFSPDVATPVYSAGFLVASCFVMTAIGLPLVNLAQKHVTNA